MAENRFKKGVENIKQAENQLSNKLIDNVIDNTKENIQHNIINNIQDNTLDDTGSNILSNILDNILIKDATGGNYTFYLSGEVADQVSKVAKQKKISKSKLVDNILRQVLLNK